MQVSIFHLIFAQSQRLDACSSSADLRLFNFVPESSNRIVQTQKKTGDNQSPKPTVFVSISASSYRAPSA